MQFVQSGLALILSPALCSSERPRALVPAVPVRKLSQTSCPELATEAAWNRVSGAAVTELRIFCVLGGLQVGQSSGLLTP